MSVGPDHFAATVSVIFEMSESYDVIDRGQDVTPRNAGDISYYLHIWCIYLPHKCAIYETSLMKF